MLFFGLFVLVVLPIALIYMAEMIKKSETFRHTATGGIIRFVLYLFAGMAILSDILIIGKIFKLV
jgi:uncharacterized protein YqhQ